MPSAGTAPSWTTAKRSVSSVTSEQPHGFAGISGLAGHEASPRLAGLRLDGGGARLLERDRPALYRLQLLALQELSGLQGEQLVGRLCDLQGADGGLAPIAKIGQRRLLACALADPLRLHPDRGDRKKVV